MPATDSKLVFREMSSHHGQPYTSSLYFGSIPTEIQISQVQAVCFSSNPLLQEIVLYEHLDGYLGLPGGGVEGDESPEQALKREIQEEINARLISCEAFGYNIAKPIFGGVALLQARYAAIVALNDGPVRDPAGKSLKRHVVERQDAAAMLAWGRRGELLISKAFEVLQNHARAA